jgi:hypothetical protein
MKTTIDMPNSLFQRTKAMARNRHVTMRELITEGLLHVLEQKGADAPRQITPVTFRGEGISPEFSKAAWREIRDAIYEDRGA